MGLLRGGNDAAVAWLVAIVAGVSVAAVVALLSLRLLRLLLRPGRDLIRSVTRVCEGSLEREGERQL